jgi:hypothetical protein
MSHNNTDYFITNRSGNRLGQIMVDKIGGSEKIDALVGYFYWSGFEGIYNSLKGKKLRILVGMEVDSQLQQFSSEKCFVSKNQSTHQIRQEYFHNEKKRVEKTIEMESPEALEAMQVYLEMIKSGDLEIRKTKESNHAKLYIFHNQQSLVKSHGGGQIITGSSNFSRSGFVGREEINVNLKDDYVYQQSVEIFEDLWQAATPILNQDTVDEFETQVLEQTFLSAKPTPFEFYLRTLIELFDYSKESIIPPSKISEGGDRSFDDLEYQLDAIKEGISKIKTHKGVIIADVVGLGKSIIASTIAHNLNLPTVVIAPPHLTTQWYEYSSDFNFRAQNSIYSSGKILEAYQKEYNSKQKKLIIIDEAHKYRNENTEDHKYLMEICRGNFVILLTATPYNNSPKDLKSLLRLFQIQGSPTIHSIENIFDKFTELQVDYDKLKKELKGDKANNEGDFSKIASELKTIIEPVLIRRSRLDLKNIKRYAAEIGSKINLAKVEDPKLITYQLGDWESLYIQTLQKIFPSDQEKVDSINLIKKGFKGVRYSPASYIKNWDTRKVEFENIFGTFETAQIAGTNLAKMMKNLLVRRFESSVEAFKCSLRNTIKTHEIILAMVQ